MALTTDTRSLRVLILRGSQREAALIAEDLRDAGFALTWQHVDALDAAVAEASSGAWDVLLADSARAHVSVPALVERLRESGVDLPVIATSGVVHEPLAMELLRQGARDLVPPSRHVVDAGERERLGAESRRGVGQTPEQVRHATPPSEADAPPPTPAAAMQPAGTVLVVEDEAGVREMMRQVLQRAGLHVLLAGCGNEGIRVAGEWPGRIDLVLSDLVMPGLAGDEVLRRVHQLHPEAGLVLMTGYATNAAGLDGSSHDVLPKPFSPRELIGVVRRQLESGTTEAGRR